MEFLQILRTPATEPRRAFARAPGRAVKRRCRQQLAIVSTQRPRFDARVLGFGRRPDGRDLSA
jgi:hypothetical protein